MIFQVFGPVRQHVLLGPFADYNWQALQILASGKKFAKVNATD